MGQYYNVVQRYKYINIENYVNIVGLAIIQLLFR